MGRGTVLANMGEGLYSVSLDAGDGLRAKRIAAINKKLAEVAAEIAQLQVDMNAAKAALAQAKVDANEAIDELAELQRQDEATPEQLIEASDKASKAVELSIKASESVQQIDVQMRPLKAVETELNKEKARLQSLPVSRVVEAWCVDLTEDASGDVATIEVPGEPLFTLIAPGGVAPTAADGRVLARALMSPEQAFWNAAVLPGWQKWKPTYRKGTVTAVQGERLSVMLDDVGSSAQDLPINLALFLEDVPAKYMTCDAAAFAINDRVIVKFEDQDPTRPLVVGFVEKPRVCNPWNAVGVQINTNRSPPIMGWLVLKAIPGSIADTSFVPNAVSLQVRHPGGAWLNVPYGGFGNGVHGWGYYEPTIDWYEASYYTSVGNMWTFYAAGPSAPFLRLPLFRENFAANPVTEPMPFGAVQYKMTDAQGRQMLDVGIGLDSVLSLTATLRTTCNLAPMASFYHTVFQPAGAIPMEQVKLSELGF